MAEIDTRPLESVRKAVAFFEPKSDLLNGYSPADRSAAGTTTKEEEIISLTNELATCKLLLEAEENETEQQSETTVDDECEALRDELAVMRAELDAARASVAVAVREAETVEARAIAERESTRKALTRILHLNETVLSSAVAAVRAEEERSVFFQQVTLEFFNNPDNNLEVIRRQVEMMEGELLAKTVEVEYLRSELSQTKLEKYVSPSTCGDELKQLDGYALGPGQAAATGEVDAVKNELLDAARAEIGDLRFSLEEAVRRAELAEEAKAALERELRDQEIIRNKHPSRRRRATSDDSEDGRRPARDGPPTTTTTTPASPLQMPARDLRPGGEAGTPTPRCVPLGKVLNMKYK